MTRMFCTESAGGVRTGPAMEDCVRERLELADVGGLALESLPVLGLAPHRDAMKELRTGGVQHPQPPALTLHADRELQRRVRPQRARHPSRVALRPAQLGLHPSIDVR